MSICFFIPRDALRDAFGRLANSKVIKVIKRRWEGELEALERWNVHIAVFSFGFLTRYYYVFFFVWRETFESGDC